MHGMTELPNCSAVHADMPEQRSFFSVTLVKIKCRECVRIYRCIRISFFSFLFFTCFADSTKANRKTRKLRNTHDLDDFFSEHVVTNLVASTVHFYRASAYALACRAKYC